MCIVQLSQLIVMYVIPAGMCGTVIPVAVLMCGNSSCKKKIKSCTMYMLVHCACAQLVLMLAFEHACTDLE